MSLRKTILLVEDEAVIALAEARTLETAGYRVIPVYTAEEALQTVRSTPEIDLILMDVDLGGGPDGTEIAEQILNDYDLPIVFLSAHTDTETVEKTEGITTYGYIVKHTGSTVLLAAIKMAFKLFEAHREIQEKNEELQKTVAALDQVNADFRNANEKLAWWDEIMQYVIKHNPSGITVLDENLSHLYVSDRFLEDNRSGAEDVIGKNHYDVFPHIPQRWRDIHQRVLGGEVLHNDDDFLEKPDGTVDRVRWACRSWYEADGTVGGIVIYTDVITEEKRAEDALRRSEGLLNRVEDFSKAGGWEWDIGSQSMYWTPGLQRFYGKDRDVPNHSSDELLKFGLTPFEKVDRDTILSAFQQCSTDGTPFTCEYPFAAPDGAELWVRVSMDAVREGDHIKRVVGSLMDISPLKQVKEELQAFLDNSPLLISEFTPDGRYIRVNTSFAHAMRISPH